jgi:hypothetical protein
MCLFERFNFRWVGANMFILAEKKVQLKKEQRAGKTAQTTYSQRIQ